LGKKLPDSKAWEAETTQEEEQKAASFSPKMELAFEYLFEQKM
jgi:hypothetical protein